MIFRRLMSAFVVALLLTSLSVPGAAVPPQVQVEPLDFKPPQAERVVLKNGVVVFLAEDHELPVFDMQMLIHVSPADEPVSDTFSFFGPVWRAGGTLKRTPEQLNLELESMPASVETGADNEALTISASSLSKNMDTTLALFTEVLLHPAFREDQIVLQRSKMMEALLRKNETPNQIARRAFRDVAYGKDHIYAYESTPASLKKVSRNDLMALHKKAVVPDQAVIAVAGDFKKEELIAKLERLFEPWPASGRTVPPYDYAVKNPSAGRVFFVSKDAAQSRLTIAQIGPSRHTPDRFALSIADYILGGGGPSRLFGEIRSRLGLAYMVGSFVLEFKGPGLIGVACQTKSASSVAAAQAILDQLRVFTENLVTDAELALAKDALINSYVFGFESPFQVVSARASNEFYGYPVDYVDIYTARLAAITAADVLRVGRKYYTPSNMKIIVVGNEKKFDVPLDTLGSVTVIPLADIN